MRRFGRYLEGIACFDCAGRLTLYGKLEAAFQDIGGFDSRMRVSPDRHPCLYCRFDEQRHIARRRTVHLRQNLSRDAGRCCGWRALGRRLGGDNRRNSADCARRNTREFPSRQHTALPFCIGISKGQIFLMQIVGPSRLGYKVKAPIVESLLDHLIRPPQQRGRDRQAKRFRGLEVDDQLELRRLLDGKVRGFGAVQDD